MHSSVFIINEEAGSHKKKNTDATGKRQVQSPDSDINLIYLWEI